MERSRLVRGATAVAVTLAMGMSLGIGPAVAGRPDGHADTTASGRPSGRAGLVAGRTAPTWTATLVLSFTDPLNGFHPMGITSDGSHYYTTNGGNSGSCVVNTFGLDGTLENSQACGLDNRAIIWDPTQGHLYTKDYILNANRIDAATGGSRLKGSGWFVFAQSSPALSFDQRHLLEHENGTIRVLRTRDGLLVDTLTGFRYGGYPSGEAVAVDDAGDVLTWDGTTVYVQDMSGNLLATIDVPSGSYGFSLSFTNGLLFTADDVDGSGNATWYGYTIEP